MEHKKVAHLYSATLDSATVDHAAINSPTSKVQHQIMKHKNSTTVIVKYAPLNSATWRSATSNNEQ